MELLVLLIAELLSTFVVPVFLVVVEFIITVVSLVAYLIFGVALKKPSTATAQPERRAPVSPMFVKAVKGGCWLFGGLFVIGLVAALVVNTLFFASTVAWVARIVTERSGIEIAFDDVEGNFFTGRFQFDGLKVARRVPEKTEYALTVDKTDAKIELLSLVGQPKLSHLAMSGIGGDIWSKRRNPGLAGAATGDAEGAGRLRPRKNFEIRSLEISNAKIAVHRGTAPPLTVTIESLESPSLRSRYAIFDAAFRTNLRGAINGHEISLGVQTGDGLRNSWRLEDFPADLLGLYVDRPPVNWFDKGMIDVAVENRLGVGDGSDINMDWRIVLKQIRLTKPGDGPLLGRATHASMARFFAAREKDVDLRFQLVMKEEQFETRASLDAAGLWKAVLKGAAKTVAAKSETGLERAGDKVKGSIDKVMDFFKRDKAKSVDD